MTLVPVGRYEYDVVRGTWVHHYQEMNGQGDMEDRVSVVYPIEEVEDLVKAHLQKLRDDLLDAIYSKTFILKDGHPVGKVITHVASITLAWSKELNRYAIIGGYAILRLTLPEDYVYREVLIKSNIENGEDKSCSYFLTTVEGLKDPSAPMLIEPVPDGMYLIKTDGTISTGEEE